MANAICNRLRRFCWTVSGFTRHAAAGFFRKRSSFHTRYRLMSAPTVPTTRNGIRRLLRWKPCAGPPAVAAMSELRPNSTRTPLKPTTATQMLSAVARANEPQVNAKDANLDLASVTVL